MCRLSILFELKFEHPKKNKKTIKLIFKIQYQ